MAKLCSSFGSSPNFSFLTDEIYGADLEQINPELGLSNSDLGIIGPDPAELFDDVNLLNIWPTSSIYSDIKRIQADSPTICDSFMENCALTDLKPEIRNMDCMWSASTSLLGSSASSSLSDVVNSTTAVPLSAITGSNTQNIHNNNNNNNINNNMGDLATQKIVNANSRLPLPTVVVAANKLNSSSSHSNGSPVQQQQFDTLLVKQEIKEEPLDDYEQQLQQHSIPTTSKQQPQQKSSDTFTTNTMQHIPPGTSLLRKSQVQQQYKLKLKQQATTTTPQTTNNLVRERDQLLTSVNNKHHNNNNSSNNNSRVKLPVYTNGSSLQNFRNFGRPDTPHSLDDDNTNNNNSNNNINPEFKHSIDLHACVVGSNNISLTSDPNKYIHHVSQELQDTSKTQIDLRYVTSGCSTLAEVAEVLEGIDGEKCSLGSDATTASSSGVDCDSDSAGEDEDAWNVGESTRCSMDSMLDATEEANAISGYGINNSAASPVPSQDSLMSGSSNSYHHNYDNNSTQQPPYITHSDHSYTRCKDGVDDLRPSIETPSDSGKFLYQFLLI